MLIPSRLRIRHERDLVLLQARVIEQAYFKAIINRRCTMNLIDGCLYGASSKKLLFGFRFVHQPKPRAINEPPTV